MLAEGDMAVSKSIVCWLPILLAIHRLRCVAASEESEEEAGK